MPVRRPMQSREVGGPRSGRYWRYVASLLLLGAVSALASAGADAALPVDGHRSPFLVSTAGSAAGEWTTYGDSSLRQSTQPASPVLQPLRRRWTRTNLDGTVYGEPIVSAGLVYVATENATVYALRASTGRIVWTRHLGTPVPAGDLPCGDISPTVGVSSTMVADVALGRIFVSSALLVRGAIRHRLFALALATGAVEFSRGLDVAHWNAAAQLQRTGLALDEGRVIVGFGGNYGDCSQYHGYVMGVPETGTGATLVYRVPTKNEGAVWAPSGVAVDGAGNIYFATGNGSSQTSFDHGDSVIELSAALRARGYFAPSNWAADNATDADLGSTSPIIVPGNEIFMVGKEETAFILDASRLGGVGHQLSSFAVCNSRGGNAYSNGNLYIACPDASLTALKLSGTSMSLLWRAPGGVSGSPTVAGGLVWAISSGRLLGLDPGNGSVVVSIPTIDTPHFAAPSAAEGLLFVAGNGVEAYQGPSGYLG